MLSFQYIMNNMGFIMKKKPEPRKRKTLTIRADLYKGLKQISLDDEVNLQVVADRAATNLLKSRERTKRNKERKDANE